MDTQEVQDATKATDLFGPVTADLASRRAAKRKYRLLIQAVHPDKGGNADLFRKLQEFYEAWEQGLAAPVKKTAAAYKAGKWKLGDLLHKGSIANLYASETKALVKIPRKTASNHFIQAEIDALTLLSSAPHKLYPRLLDSGTAGDRQFSVQSDFTSGYFTLTQVLAKRPLIRLAGSDYAWMHRRLLGALAGAHQQGIVHGAVLPDHVLIHPASHDVRLVGWSFSGKPGIEIPARIKSHQDFYPKDKNLSFALDVYMAHGVMRHALSNKEVRQQQFARGCTLSSPGARPTALQALTEYDDLLYSLYGKRTFRPFHI